MRCIDPLGGFSGEFTLLFTVITTERETGESFYVLIRK